MYHYKVVFFTLLLIIVSFFFNEEKYVPKQLIDVYDTINWKNSIIVLCHNEIPDFSKDVCYKIYVKQENFNFEYKRYSNISSNITVVSTRMFDYLYDDHILIKKNNIIFPLNFFRNKFSFQKNNSN